jgi:AraC family transcriptional regulator
MHATDFFADRVPDAHRPASWHAALRLRDGSGAFAWTGEAGDSTELAVIDDTGCAHFSYWLRGGACCRLDGNRGEAQEVRTGTGILAHAPGRECRFRRNGPYVNVAVLMPTSDLLDSPSAVTPDLRRNLMEGFCYRDDYRSTSLHAAAVVLFEGLRGGANQAVHPLWFQAKCLEFVSLFLDDQSRRTPNIPASEYRRLLAARDRLLADLADPPTIAELARECGLNVLKLKRGFKQLFGLGVFGLFQRERMHAARLRLARGDVDVAHVAAEFGYVNASHFAAAFRREFGVSPAAIKRGLPVTRTD